jgi:hypothetical protein
MKNNLLARFEDRSTGIGIIGHVFAGKPFAGDEACGAGVRVRAASCPLSGPTPHASVPPPPDDLRVAGQVPEFRDVF